MCPALASRFAIPALAGLDDQLVANLVLSMALGQGFAPGNAQHLVTAFVRTTESALRRYEAARVQLQASAAHHSLAGYLRGLDDMELTYIALNRAMRLAVALKQSPETRISRSDLPAKQEQDRLRLMRAAIEHREGPIKANLAGIGKTIALSVGENESTIEDANRSYTATHEELACWVQALHALAVKLTNEPQAWSRPT